MVRYDGSRYAARFIDAPGEHAWLYMRKVGNNDEAECQACDKDPSGTFHRFLVAQ
jgi:hypothetical protein